MRGFGVAHPPDDTTVISSTSEGGRSARQRRAQRRAAGKDGGGRAAQVTALGNYSVPNVVEPARVRLRHVGLLLSLILVVLVPQVGIAWYLWNRAHDQYASHVAFAVRQEGTGSSLDIAGGLAQLTGGSSSSSDTDILNEFIQSQDMVEKVNARLDLPAIFSRPENDPIFAFDPSGTIEDLLRHWKRKVRVNYDPGAGLIEIRVLAFDPIDAREIASAILQESSEMINMLSAIARDDAMSFSRDELETAMARLRDAREAVTAFRSRTQLVDPSADIQGQMGLLNNLQQQLAGSLVELDLLRETTRDTDPRIVQVERRIEVINRRIAEERQKFSVGGMGPGGEDYATLVAEYERLTVDREFAEQSYRNALATYDAAIAEARRQSRYLAAYVSPTLAQRAEYPQRLQLLGLSGLFLFLTWGIGALVYYSIRDRR
jgi:capsular polysaccharide transport system permease protein